MVIVVAIALGSRVMARSSQFSQVPSAAGGKQAPEAAFLDIRCQYSYRRHRLRTKRRAPAIVGPAQTWTPAIVSKLKVTKLHVGRGLDL
jgi:hypothetical protein